MTKRALFTIAGFLGFCLAASAQQPGPLFFGPTFDRGFSSLALEDQNRFFFSTGFGSMRTTGDFLPAFNPSEPLSMAYLPTTGHARSVENIVDLRAPNRIQVGGEVGFLFGKSSGKYGREDFQSYIIGTVGNDKFSITAGYLHQETTFNSTRWRR